MAATYHHFGKQYNSPADLKMAEDYYNLCLDRNENHTACYRGLAVLLAEEDRSPEAFRLLEGWVARQPNVADAKIELARLSEEAGDKNAAKEHLIEALAVQKDNPRALTALAKLQDDSGNFQQAFDQLSTLAAWPTAVNRKWPPGCRLANRRRRRLLSPSRLGGTQMIETPTSPKRY